MKTSVILFCALLAASIAAADPYSAAMRQARRASDQNAAEQRQLQRQENGAAPPAAPVPGAVPANPALAATLQNITNLQTDITALNAVADGKPTSDQRISLLNDLSSAAQGNKASADSIRALAKDLTTALAGKKIAPERQMQLARYLHASFNSSHLSAAQAPVIFNGAQKILTDAGVASDDATRVVSDLKKIAAETK